MTEIAIVEIDAILKLVEAMRLSANELVRLDKAGHNPGDLEGYYLAALQALEWRTAYSAQAAQQITSLVELAELDGITLNPALTEVPVVQIPIYGFGLM